MVKIALVLTIVLVSTGLVAGLEEAGADSIGPLAFIVIHGDVYSCYEIFAREAAPNQLSLRGQTKFFNNGVASQAVIGHLVINGPNAVWGLEAFPTAALPVAAKIGGLVSLATLTGNGTAFHLASPSGFFFAFLFQILFGLCPAPQDVL